jgi:hypothetical protein
MGGARRLLPRRDKKSREWEMNILMWDNPLEDRTYLTDAIQLRTAVTAAPSALGAPFLPPSRRRR